MEYTKFYSQPKQYESSLINYQIAELLDIGPRNVSGNKETLSINMEHVHTFVESKASEPHLPVSKILSQDQLSPLYKGLDIIVNTLIEEGYYHPDITIGNIGFRIIDSTPVPVLLDFDELVKFNNVVNCKDILTQVIVEYKLGIKYNKVTEKQMVEDMLYRISLVKQQLSELF